MVTVFFKTLTLSFQRKYTELKTIVIQIFIRSTLSVQSISTSVLDLPSHV
jgi:hypothetical protein